MRAFVPSFLTEPCGRKLFQMMRLPAGAGVSTTRRPKSLIMASVESGSFSGWRRAHSSIWRCAVGAQTKPPSPTLRQERSRRRDCHSAAPPPLPLVVFFFIIGIQMERPQNDSLADGYQEACVESNSTACGHAVLKLTHSLRGRPPLAAVASGRAVLLPLRAACAARRPSAGSLRGLSLRR